jgi:hypothetical protein
MSAEDRIAQLELALRKIAEHPQVSILTEFDRGWIAGRRYDGAIAQKALEPVEEVAPCEP